MTSGSLGSSGSAKIASAWTESARTVIDSSCWDLFLKDPLARHQRWYCKLCNKRYKASFGVLIQILHKGIANYVYADLPPMHFYDAKGMLIAKIKPEYTTPETLYNAISQAKPIGNFLAPTHVEGHYSITGFDQLLELKKNHIFDWNQLYHLPKVRKAGSAAVAVAADFDDPDGTLQYIRETAPLLLHGVAGEVELDVIEEC